MISVKSRLIRLSALGLGVVFCAAAVMLYLVIREELIEEFDTALETEVRAVAGTVEQGERGLKFEMDQGQMAAVSRVGRTHFYELWDEANASVARSPSLGAARLPRLRPSRGRKMVHGFVTLANGRPGRMTTVEFQPREEGEGRGGAGHSYYLGVAADTGELDRTLSRLGAALAGVFLIAGATALGVMRFVIVRAMRPLGELAALIGQVRAEDLGSRIEVANSPTEVAPLVDRLNELLGRLGAAIEREKAFTAEVAHELRTPLAGLTTSLEVSLTRAREPEAYRTVLERCLAVSRGMQGMVNNLLLLARADAQQVKAEAEVLDLKNLVTERWEAYAARAARRKLTVVWSLSSAPIEADTNLVGIIISNLLDNATEYAELGGTVWITLTDAVLTIRNTGSELSSGDMGHIFDRFWRADMARTAAGVHCGIGLPLARKIAEVIGGKLYVSQLGAGIFEARLEFSGADVRLALTGV